ncbi:hypothetical protein BN7_3753 [Wickerhamomyces ciferrii]|uniref:Luciferase-like domain-containing protein n=1 Tax=Wickerhamomyces ciferrii (strain ATCC 14091 / BCRC 22168 / CBS 111 / JCM 3599 / NBRC 0793 / NRRL Y-1031 F-60-10) TaxID=1206466 RepID=K0KS85_WICCF|nr:uncharacterized protein BN7_3753 [Wickerhamomyces ciferrii]CCH44194.1 hypothetical protein BN7_3753 [Wickerhamomyces ciferrii]
MTVPEASDALDQTIKTPKKPLILSVATKLTSINWRDPTDRSRELSRDINEIINFAQLAEQAKIHNIFFVDHLSWFDVYGDSHATAARTGFNATRIDPLTTISALASHTKNIGFISTLSTVSEHPYHFARRVASADLLSGGRIGWNVVSSYIPSIGKNLLNGEPFPEHDERYAKTTEFLDVLYALLLSSWRDDAVVYDKEAGIFANPDALREINHEGKFFKVKGPGITEPTPQRFPLITQAGTSKRGVEFAAENAELIYIGFDFLPKIPDIRKLAHEKFGRDPSSLKFFTRIVPVIGETHEEAVAKFEVYKKSVDPESNLVSLGGVTGFDLSGYDWDDQVEFPDHTNGIQSSLEGLKKRKLAPTKKELADKQLESAKYVGTAQEIADQLEQIATDYDIDGFNFAINNYPESLEDIVHYLVPELQRRGLAQTEYAAPDGTLRENFNNKPGQSFLSGDHPAYSLRWRSGVSKEQFEQELEIFKKLRDERRKA